MQHAPRLIEGALTVGVTGAVHTAVNTAHHVISTPATIAIEATKSATVFVASYLIIGAVKLGCSATWWLATSAAATLAAGATTVYKSIFPEQPKMITWHDDNHNQLFVKRSKSDEDSARRLEQTPPNSPKSSEVSLTAID